MAPPAPKASELKEHHFTILYGDTGYSYESILGPYLQGAKAVVIEDPYAPGAPLPAGMRELDVVDCAATYTAFHHLRTSGELS